MSSSESRSRLLGSAAEEILAAMRTRGSLLVAFSGGVDSALVARLAHDALGDSVLAVTAASESMARHEIDSALSTAAEIGIRHRVVRYSDLDNLEYVANTGSRCYQCRRGMARHFLAVAEEEGIVHLADGVIVDDLVDYRPGMVAMEEAGFWHPLVEAGLCKEDVRRLAKRFGLSAHDRPSNACLSSRIAHGTPVSADLLRRVESGEDFLRSLGFSQIRVRAVNGMARVEVGREEVSRLLRADVAGQVRSSMTALGFDGVLLDPRGYRTGSLNPTQSS